LNPLPLEPSALTTRPWLWPTGGYLVWFSQIFEVTSLEAA